jgi:MFS family permease
MYFLLNWFIYSTHGFYNQYLKAVWGLGVDQINLSYIWQFLTVFSGPYWGSLADRTGRFRQIAAFCVIMNCFCLCMMAFPMFERGSIWRVVYFNVLSTISAIFSSGTFPIIDAIVLSILEADPNSSKDDYSCQKMFGAISHNLCTKGIHFIYETFSEDYFVMFYSASTAMLLLVSTIMLMVSDGIKIKAHKHHGPAKKVMSEEDAASASMTALQLAMKPEFFFFLVVILVSGIVRCVNTNNHSTYLTEVLYLGKNDVAELMFYRIPVEIGLLWFAKKIMQKTGPYWFLLTGLFVGVLRMFMYALLVPDRCRQWLYYIILVIIEVLKGANSSLISAGAFRIASDLAPAHLQASSQTFVAACWQGLSMSCSAILAYVVMKIYSSESEGIRGLFNWTTGLGFLAFVVISVYFAFIKKVLF